VSDLDDTRPFATAEEDGTRSCSGRAAQRDDGKMLATFDVAHAEREPVGMAATTSSMRPLRSRLESALSPTAARPDFLWSFSGKRHVRTLGVEPGRVQVELAPYPGKRQRREQEPRALILHRSDEALDDGDAGGFPDTAVARTDSATLAPGLEAAATELLALVGDDVARRLTLSPNGPFEETLDLGR
jgi:hypothetical protein